MKQKLLPESPSKTLQIVFLVGVIGLFAVQAIETGGHIIAQLPTNQNLSGFMGWLLPGFALPILLALVAIAAKKDRTLNIRTAFEVTLLIVSVTLFGSLIASLASTIMTNAHIPIDGYMPYFILYIGLPIVATLVLFVILLIVLHRKKQW